MDKPVLFKYRDLSPDNRPVGWQVKGSYDGRELVLGTGRVPAGVIYRVQKVLHNRVMIAFAGRDGVKTVLILISSGSRDRLVHEINLTASANMAEMHRQELARQGLAGAFRAVACPFCGATIDLTGLPAGGQTYCSYCDSLSLNGDPDATEERHYRICGKCGLYAQPQMFTSFYFWTVIVMHGYRQKIEVLCHACMRKEAWTMLGCNFLFLIGLPHAIYQLIRSYFGGSARSLMYVGMDRANALAAACRYDEAVAAYEAIAVKHTACAGVRFNQAMAMLRAGRMPEAAQFFQMSLRDAPNYVPSYTKLLPVYAATGQHAEAAALRKQWGEPDKEKDPLVP